MTAKHSRRSSSKPDDSCTKPDHPVPPELLGRYSSDGDPDAEQEIANYVHSQAHDETVQHTERIKTEIVMGEAYKIWDVTTDQDRWWVITNPTNLYSQRHFPSLDYTLSFHVGLMMRVMSRDRGPDSSEPQPFDEVLRRQRQATDLHDRAVEAEDYQAVGMQLRECLISLIAVMRRRTEIPTGIERPQDANFIAWSGLLMDHLCSGGSNKDLRQYMKAISEKTWKLVGWLTHHREAGKTASSIALRGVDTLVGHYVQLLMRGRTDRIDRCPLCSSRDLRVYFDIEIDPDGDHYTTCGSCDWSSQPDHADRRGTSMRVDE